MSAHIDLDAEAAVLGAVLLGGGPVLTLVQATGLRPEHFYRETHGEIFAAMARLDAEERGIDALTVHAMLRGRSDVSKGQVDALAAAPPVTGNAPGYARIVVEEARWRWRELKLIEAQEAVGARDIGSYQHAVTQARKELAR